MASGTQYDAIRALLLNMDQENAEENKAGVDGSEIDDVLSKLKQAIQN